MALGLLCIILALSGCETQGNGEPSRLMVVATTSIWADVARAVAGTDAEVVTLIPRGADSHDYQPSPQQVAAIAEADLVIANGLGLEEGLEDVLASAAADGANVLELAPHLDPQPFPGHDQGGAEGEEPGRDPEGLDPHVWFDPTRVAEAARLIADRLSEVEPEAGWADRAAAHAAEMESLDDEISEVLSRIEAVERKLVTNHESLGYFAERYGFSVVGVVVPGGSTLADPSSAQLAALVEEIVNQGVPAIFAETSAPTRLAEAVAAEAGDIEVVALDTESLSEPGTESGTLVGMLRANAKKIADALG